MDRKYRTEKQKKNQKVNNNVSNKHKAERGENYTLSSLIQSEGSEFYFMTVDLYDYENK